MSAKFNEDTVEYAAIDWLKSIGYEYIHGEDIEPETSASERDSFHDVVLVGRLRSALSAINTHIPASARAGVVDEVVRKVLKTETVNPVLNNHNFHRLLTEGVDVSFRDKSGQMKHDKVWLVDFANPRNNQFLAVNQFTVTDVNHSSNSRTNRRPDVICFVNGLPLVILELKNAASESATINSAWNQLQTYKNDIGTLFTYNALLVISDGISARLGSLTAGKEWFKQWRTIDGEMLDPCDTELETLISGALAPEYLLDLVRFFTVFENTGSGFIKKIAGYHQYHAVNKALQATVKATGAGGDQRVGVIWHTQGSGKSLSMLFYAGKVISEPAMKNPTLVILTDRNDLDDQLFSVFASGDELLRQTPEQAKSRDDLREKLKVASGGVVFTTIQKFQPDDDSTEYPMLSDRKNIVFIADEAHRSQYGFGARMDSEGGISYGFAKYVRDALPNASFIGFTGTPVEKTDANTRQVFGDYIDIYDIQRAVDDKATVPIYYEARLARIQLREEKRPEIDPEFEYVTEGEEDYTKEKLKSKWSQLEAMVGTEERLAQVANDIVTHFEQRLDVMDGKGMIVTMSRRIAVDLYEQIIKLRPEWHSDKDDEGAIKVIMTGSASDPANYQPHVRNKPRRKALADNFKDPESDFKLVIVRDMWLTGFDAPIMHTMYIDKPMQGHGLMQAIARVNRVFRDKPGGLIVDYLGIATDLQQAVETYTDSGGQGQPAVSQEQVVEALLTRYDIVKAFFHKFDYQAFFDGSPTERISIIPRAMEHILSQDDGKKRYVDEVTKLTKAFALATPHESALEIREEVAFFQAVRSAFTKNTAVEGQSKDDYDSAIKQIVSGAVASNEVINIFDAAGLKSPDVSILSDEFLDDLNSLPQKNLAMELLRKLLDDEIKSRSKKNAVQSRSFADMLEQTIRRYQNRSIDAAEVIVELIDIAKEVRDAGQRGEQLGLTEDEVAFYDALAENKSAVDLMGDKQLATIATMLVQKVRENVTIDWTVKQTARAKIRTLVKRILRQYGYPPDLQEDAANLVLEQAELLAAEWAKS